MNRATAVLLVALALWLVPPAGSSVGRFAVRLSVDHATVRMNMPVRVRMQVYTFTSGARAPSDDPRFGVVAVSAQDERIRIRLHRLSRGTWSGSVRLRAAGPWTLRLAAWPGAGTGPLVVVHVREMTATEPTPRG